MSDILTTKKIDAALKDWMDGPYGDSLRKAYGPGPRPIERYVRCSVDIPGGSVELGIAYERGDGFSLTRLREQMRQLVRRAVARDLRYVEVSEHNADDLTAGIEADIMAVLPASHAWFVEIWDEHEALTQVYAPFGMPRNTTP